jgi:hypothetical protein
MTFGLFALIASAPALAWAATEAGKIVLVKGDVFILDAKNKSVVADPTGKRGRSTQKGSPFFEGETIQTKDGARVKLLFNEGGNEIVLGSGTSLVIERAGAKQPGTELNLKQGTVRSSVNKKYSGEGGDIFEVKTPNSVAGVRGTIFNVAYDNKKNMTQVLTERGSVAVSSLTSGANAKPIMVNAGMFSEVKKGETPTPAQTAPAHLLESISPESETNQNASSSGDAPKNSATPGETKKDDAPTVALAPQPADSTSSSGARAPASAESAAPVAPKTISSGSLSPIAASTTSPLDIVNRSGESLRKAAEEQLRQQRLIEGNQSEIFFKVQ